MTARDDDLRADLRALADEWERDEAYHCANARECEECVSFQRAVIRLRAVLDAHEPAPEPDVTYACCGAPVGDVVRMDHRCEPATEPEAPMSEHTAENDAAEPCVCGSGFTCMARHGEPTERERLAQEWADHYGHDGTIHENIGLGLGCRFGSSLRDDVCHSRVIPPGRTTETDR